MVKVEYELVLDTDEPDRRLEFIHENVRRYGTISNTVSAALELTGVLRCT
ncbi:hypothetical protein [Azospirillum sp. 11R-A]